MEIIRKRRFKKTVTITASVFLGIILLIVAAYIMFWIGVDSLAKSQRGTIQLPNKTTVYKITTKGPYEIALSTDDTKQLVKPNVEEVGWNERFVLFKRSDENSQEVGVLDTKTQKVKTVPFSEGNLKFLYTEYGISSNVTMKTVGSLWPDMSKMR
jgi:hypothetical protein